MKTVKLGNTGVEVSSLPLGTMKFGSFITDEESVSVLDCYYEEGGRFLDTANMYAYWANDTQGGEAETVIGKWLKERKNRADLFIASKVGLKWSQESWDNRTFGLSRDKIISHCEKSLKRLGVDTIDLYYCHYDDRETPIEETLEAMHQLIKAGKIRFIGASNWMSWRLEEARMISEYKNLPFFCCNQQKHSYLRPRYGEDIPKDPEIRVLEDEMIDFCKTRNVTILSHEALLKGIYLRQDEPLMERFNYDTMDNYERLRVLNEVAKEVDANPLQVVVAWMLHSDPIVLPIITASSVARLKENIVAGEIKLSKEQMDRLNKAVHIPKTV